MTLRSNSYYKNVISKGSPEQIQKALQELEALGFEWDYIEQRVIEPVKAQIRKEKEIEYIKKLRGATVELEGLGDIGSFMKAKMNRDRTRPDAVDYHNTRNYLWDSYRILVWEKSTLKITSKMLNQEALPIFKNLCHWLMGNPKGEWNPDRSLYFYGGLGVGKSTLAQAAHYVLSFYKTKTGWTNRYLSFESMENLAMEAMSEEKLNRMSRFGTGGWILDDIKPEHYQVNYFGNQVQLVNRILHARHQAWERGQQTIITSNTSWQTFTDPEHLNDRRLTDRILEQYIPVHFEGSNYRKPAARLQK